MLTSPLNIRAATFTAKLGQAGASTDPLSQLNSYAASGVLDRTRGAITELVAAPNLTPGVIALSLLAAVALGALHALEPGHGKTVVAAYLVGSRGTAKQALLLGTTVTVTHTAGVYVLGLVTLFLSQYILPERLYPILQAVSGLLVVGIGLWLLARRVSGLRIGRWNLGAAPPPMAVHEHSHTHSEDHSHAPAGRFQRLVNARREREHGEGLTHSHGGATHSHAVPAQMSLKSLVAMGISGGLVPCPGALVVLLGAVALQRVGFGLLLIVAFSLGLAAVLVGIGFLLVYARGFFNNFSLGGSWGQRLLPVASAFVITAVGAALTMSALPAVL
jgi:ABC-type nickel/cobalt efflux system permease component RcnA